MGLKTTITGAAEQFAIGYFIKRVESGQYGPRLQAVWLALKGRKSIIGWSVFVIGAAIATFPSPEATAFGASLAVAGSYLGRFGLVAKGADKTPPPFPEEYRPALEFALSAATYVVEIVTGIAGLLLISGSAQFQEWSVFMLVAAQGVSTATGYLATLAGKPPTPARSRMADDIIEGKE